MGEKKRRDQKEICPPEADPPLAETAAFVGQTTAAKEDRPSTLLPPSFGNFGEARRAGKGEGKGG